MITPNLAISNRDFDVKSTEIKKKNDEFLNTINSIKNTTNISLTYEDIKTLSIEEIEEKYTDEDEKILAKNLKMATFFSKDEILSKTLFNFILKKPISSGYDYLSSKFSDKNNYLKAKFDNTSLFDLLHMSLSYSINGNKNNISKNDLDDILLKVNSFDFLDSLSSNYKKGYDKYKEKNNKYSFLYDNYSKEYDEIIKNYKELEEINKSIIKQF